MDKTIIITIVTRVATIAAASLVTHGIIQSNDQTMVIGAFVAVATGLATWWETSGQKAAMTLLKAQIDHLKGKAAPQTPKT